MSASPDRVALVTGGAGFIGSALCRHLVRSGRTEFINLDKLTYAGSLAALTEVERSPLYRFVQGDIADTALVAALPEEERVDAIMQLRPKVMPIGRSRPPTSSSTPTSWAPFA